MTTFLSTFGLILVALAIIVGACVFGRRLLGKLWWLLGRLLNWLTPDKKRRS